MPCGNLAKKNAEEQLYIEVVSWCCASGWPLIAVNELFPMLGSEPAVAVAASPRGFAFTTAPEMKKTSGLGWSLEWVPVAPGL